MKNFFLIFALFAFFAVKSFAAEVTVSPAPETVSAPEKELQVAAACRSRAVLDNARLQSELADKEAEIKNFEALLATITEKMNQVNEQLNQLLTSTNGITPQSVVAYGAIRRTLRGWQTNGLQGVHDGLFVGSNVPQNLGSATSRSSTAATVANEPRTADAASRPAQDPLPTQLSSASREASADEKRPEPSSA
jgi:hypothetical protein